MNTFEVFGDPLDKVTVVLNTDTFTDMSSIGVAGGAHVITNDANVAAGATMNVGVDAEGIFDGSHETDREL